MTYAEKIPLWQRYECGSWYIFLLAELAVSNSTCLNKQSVIVTKEREVMGHVCTSLCAHTHTHTNIWTYIHIAYKYIDKHDHAHVCGHMFINILTFYEQ